jgi:hypothetical protein
MKRKVTDNSQVCFARSQPKHDSILVHGGVKICHVDEVESQTGGGASWIRKTSGFQAWCQNKVNQSISLSRSGLGIQGDDRFHVGEIAETDWIKFQNSGERRKITSPVVFHHLAQALR